MLMLAHAIHGELTLHPTEKQEIDYYDPATGRRAEQLKKNEKKSLNKYQKTYQR